MRGVIKRTANSILFLNNDIFYGNILITLKVTSENSTEGSSRLIHSPFRCINLIKKMDPCDWFCSPGTQILIFTEQYIKRAFFQDTTF